jgi:hypothetical protein
MRFVLRALTLCGGFQLFGIRRTITKPPLVIGTAFMRKPSAGVRFRPVLGFRGVAALVIWIASEGSDGGWNAAALINSND